MCILCELCWMPVLSLLACSIVHTCTPICSSSVCAAKSTPRIAARRPLRRSSGRSSSSSPTDAKLPHHSFLGVLRLLILYIDWTCHISDCRYAQGDGARERIREIEKHKRRKKAERERERLTSITQRERKRERIDRALDTCRFIGMVTHSH